MPDWALCEGERPIDGKTVVCPKRDACARYLCLSQADEHRQSYVVAPFDEKTGHCSLILYPGS